MASARGRRGGGGARGNSHGDRRERVLGKEASRQPSRHCDSSPGGGTHAVHAESGTGASRQSSRASSCASSSSDSGSSRDSSPSKDDASSERSILCGSRQASKGKAEPMGASETAPVANSSDDGEESDEREGGNRARLTYLMDADCIGDLPKRGRPVGAKDIKPRKRRLSSMQTSSMQTDPCTSDLAPAAPAAQAPVQRGRGGSAPGGRGAHDAANGGGGGGGE